MSLPIKDTISIAVVGAHLKGFPLHKDLTHRGAIFTTEAMTSPRYRLYTIESTSAPLKPGLERVCEDSEGASISLEIWDLPTAALASFMDTIPSPLGIGKIELLDGSWVHGFICEPIGLVDAVEITSFGGWKAYTKYLSEQQA
jgi:urea carboxylase/allophanate hydrolase|uniref:Allophanate hydrolase C-terminal domain-containing protein n=1 Tax=Bionectria ochroleuca TaxID=29856 RepID=A0A8H7KD17_BIOOC